MTQAVENTTRWWDEPANHTPVREAVGLFDSEADLQGAFDRLMAEGFIQPDISALTHAAEPDKPAHIPHDRFLSVDDQGAVEGAIIGVPLLLGGLGSVVITAATGGSLALVTAAALLGGTAGGGGGALLARAFGKHHKETVAARLKQGGLVLWVRVADNEAADKAQKILSESGAHDVHLVDIDEEWGLRNIPFWDAQPDPFLEHEPRAENSQ